MARTKPFRGPPGARGPRRDLVSRKDTVLLPLFFAIFPDAIARPSQFATQRGSVRITVQPPEPAVQFPDRLERKRQTESFFAEPILPPAAAIPTQTPVYFPDTVAGVRFHASQHCGLRIAFFVPGPSVNFPDRVDRPQFHASRQLAATEISPVPIPNPAPTQFPVYFPETVRRPQFHASLHHGLRIAFFVPGPSVDFPDRIDRPFFAASQQLYATDLSPFPIPSAAPTQFPVYFPERLDRRIFGAWEQLAATPAGQPERTSPLASEWHPDRVDRPAFLASEQLAVIAENVQPERTSPLASEWHPDAIDRRVFLAANQLASTELSPKPERTSPIASTVFPDRFSVPPPWQMFFATSPQPERTSPIELPVFPDRFSIPPPWQPFFAISTQPERTSPVELPVFPDRFSVPPPQQPFFAISPQPERTSPIELPVFPDRLVKPWLLASGQQFFATSPQPERTSPIVPPVFPDRFSVPPPWQPFFATSPQPERTSPIVSTVFPDRFSVPSPWQMFFATSPQPERTSPIASAVFPDRFPRAPSWHQFFASTVQPESYVFEWHPDTLDRRFYAAANQLAVSEVSPQPERTSPIVLPVFPDRLVKPWLLPPGQQFFATSSQPERTSPIELPVFPDRFSVPPPWQPFFAISPQPERTSPVVLPVFPDRLDKPWLLPPGQQFFATSSQPERTSPIVSPVFPDLLSRTFFHPSQHAALRFGFSEKPPSVSFPDAVLRARFLTAEHLAFATSSQPERTEPIVPPVYPDLLNRTVFHPSQHAGLRFGFSEKPPIVIFSDRVDRALFQVSEQPFFAQGTQPERTVPLASTWYPDFFPRPSSHGALRGQLSVAISTPFFLSLFPDQTIRVQPFVQDFVAEPFPQVTQIFFFEPVYPSTTTRVARPEGFASAALEFENFFAGIYPDGLSRAAAGQEGQSVFVQTEDFDWEPTFQDQIERSWRPLDQYFVSSPQPERTSPLASVVYPDRIDRPTFGSFLQVAFEGSPQPERTATFFDAVYPDRFQIQVRFQDAQPEFESFLFDWDAIYPDRFPNKERTREQFSFLEVVEEEIPHGWDAVYPNQEPRVRSVLDEAFFAITERDIAEPFFEDIFPDAIHGSFSNPSESSVQPFVPPSPPPPPPPPPPQPLKPPSRTTVGTGARWWPEPIPKEREFDLPPIDLPQPLTKPTEVEVTPEPAKDDELSSELAREEADYAILPLGPETAMVRAFVDGVAQPFVDTKAGPSVLLTADDGTRYFYANVDKPRAGRVRAGEVIGETPKGQAVRAPTIPAALPPAMTPLAAMPPLVMPSMFPVYVATVLMGGAIGLFIGLAVFDSKSRTVVKSRPYATRRRRKSRRVRPR